MKSHTCGLIKTFSIIGSNPEFYLLCLCNFSPNVRINNKLFFSAAISGLTFMNLHFILLHNFDTLAVSLAPIFILCILPVSAFSFISVSVCVTQPAIPSVPPRFLTSGSWDVTLLCALDEKAGKMCVRVTLCRVGLNLLTACSSVVLIYEWQGVEEHSDHH